MIDSQRPEPDLIERLRELADATKDAQPSAHVEARVLQALAGVRRAPAPRRPVRWVPAVAASALLATIVGLLALQVRGLPPRAPAASSEAAPDAGFASLDGFVPIPGAATLPLLESASIVRYELPVGTLPRYGVDIVPDPARLAVEADLLIGQDGYARAIRLVRGGTP